LPAHTRDRATRHRVGKKLDDAARGGGMTDVAVSLQIALHLEGVDAEQSDAAPPPLVECQLGGYRGIFAGHQNFFDSKCRREAPKKLVLLVTPKPCVV
jgi:hypothetical protein